MHIVRTTSKVRSQGVHTFLYSAQQLLDVTGTIELHRHCRLYYFIADRL